MWLKIEKSNRWKKGVIISKKQLDSEIILNRVNFLPFRKRTLNITSRPNANLDYFARR